VTDTIYQVDHRLRFFTGIRQIQSKIKLDEELHENPILASGGSHLHNSICSGQANLRKNWQELPDE